MKHMPEWMLKLVKPIRTRMLKVNGERVGNLPNSDLQRRTATLQAQAMGKANKGKPKSREHQVDAGREGGKKLLELGKGIFALTPEQRSENARKASLARWGKIK